jgi:trans-2,3-dihydro-3-hydroxyanthranilate isomerase
VSGPAARFARFDPLGLGGGAALPAGARRCLTLDVFAERPLEGNPLAVLTDARGLQPASMQAIARELNLSETVFVLPPQDGGDARVRIFTPTRELPFAGHPVLGTAILLAGALEAPAVTLETGAGPVPVEVGERADRTGSGRMRQPLPTWRPFEEDAALLAALGLERSELPIEEYVNGPRHVLVALPSLEALSALAPDLGALSRLGELGVSCFCAAELRTRMFAPAMGVPEDPATGSAAGPLAVHLARHGLIAFGQEVELVQGVELGRPSRLRALAAGSPEELERVEVAGAAVVVGDGVLMPSA